jgi:hypothetical protein
MLKPAWTVIFLFVLPCVTGITDMHHHALPLVKMGSPKLYPPGAGLEW